MVNVVDTCCASLFSVMSNVSKSSFASDKYERVGPDYFGYYSSEVVNLLSQDEDVFPVSTQTPELPETKYEDARKNGKVLKFYLYQSLKWKWYDFCLLGTGT